jgi:hypothetical protein
VLEHSTVDFSIHPNPASSVVNLEFEDRGEPFNIRCTNAFGKIVLEGVQKQIDIRNLAPGLYIIQLEVGDAIGHKRLIIQ